jgi:hypothetical protein
MTIPYQRGRRLKSAARRPGRQELLPSNNFDDRACLTARLLHDVYSLPVTICSWRHVDPHH